MRLLLALIVAMSGLAVAGCNNFRNTSTVNEGPPSRFKGYYREKSVQGQVIERENSGGGEGGY